MRHRLRTQRCVAASKKAVFRLMPMSMAKRPSQRQSIQNVGHRTRGRHVDTKAMMKGVMMPA